MRGQIVDHGVAVGQTKPSVRAGGAMVTAAWWFSRGERLPYDPDSGQILERSPGSRGSSTLDVFQLVEPSNDANTGAAWTSFLPGWPDGSYGWSRVDRLLAGSDIGPRLFMDYIGHGDSDKPLDYPYSTIERATLVEALWRAHRIEKTFIVGFDYSSIVALELLARQLDRREQGRRPGTEIVGVLLANGGLFADSHSHPWFTTPMLKSPVGVPFTALAQWSRPVFKELMKPLWSKGYTVTDDEIDQLRDAIGRRNGVRALSKSAAFVDEHRRQAERWDLARLFHATNGSVAFHIVGSEQDPFEHRQPVAARQRLGAQGLDVRILPGGHLTTSEHPDRLAAIIEEVVQRAQDRR